MRELAVVIVNWNVRELLRVCLESISADLATSGLKAEVWVVDNISQDGSPEMVRAEFPQVRLIASQKNLGFAGGNNLALRQMGATGPPRYAWLLNPDTEVQPGATRALVDFMDSHPHVGVAGARLYYADGHFQHGAFRFPGLWQILFDLFPLPYRLYESRLNGRYPRAWYEGGVPFSVDHPLGAALMVRWQAIEKTGLFDESFYMYCEEIDWCMRIKRASWAIYCVPMAEVIHREGQSTRQIREDSFVNLWRSRRRLYDKHYRPIKNWIATRLVRAGMKRKIEAAQNEQTQGKETASRIQAYRRALACFEQECT